jgi:hypothetical protein
MKKGTLILMMLLVMTMPSLGNQAGVNYYEKYSIHGFVPYGRDYIHPGVSSTLEGVDVEAVSHLGKSSSDAEHWDISASLTLPVDMPVDLTAGYSYYVLPMFDAQAVSLTASLPGAISPRFSAAYIEPDRADTEGQIYTLGLDTILGEPDDISAILSTETSYNDGVNLLGGARPHDMTHISTTLKLNVPIADNIAFRPGVIYQHSFEPAILGCQRNEVWWTAGIEYRF